MNLKTVVDSIIEALREKGLDDNTIETILNTWKSREGLEDLDTNYDRNKIRTLFQVIESYYRGELTTEPSELSEIEELVETIKESIESEELEEEAIPETEESIEQSLEKELEELVKLLSGSGEEVEEEEMPLLETEEPEPVSEEDEELEKELQEFAEFLEQIREEEAAIEEPETPLEETAEAGEEVVMEMEEAKQPAIQIVEKEEEKKLRSLVEELVESTPEPVKMSDIQIRGLRLAAVIGDKKVEKVLIFREGEEKPQIAKLYEVMSSIWKLTGYEVHGFDSFHVKSGALILYGEKIEGKTYIAVVESETVGGAKFIVLALKKMLSQE